MFDFLKLRMYENKLTYQKRVEQTIKNILKGNLGTKEDFIDLVALLYCSNNNLTDKELKLKDGNEFDYQNYIMIKYINNLDEDEFIRVKNEVRNLVINNYYDYDKISSERIENKYNNIENHYGFKDNKKRVKIKKPKVGKTIKHV